MDNSRRSFIKRAIGVGASASAFSAIGGRADLAAQAAGVRIYS